MRTIKLKLGITYGLLVSILALSLVLTSYYISKGSIETVADEFLQSKIESDLKFVEGAFQTTYGQLTLVDKTLIAEDGMDLSTSHEFVDDISEMTGVATTILRKMETITLELQRTYIKLMVIELRVHTLAKIAVHMMM